MKNETLFQHPENPSFRRRTFAAISKLFGRLFGTPNSSDFGVKVLAFYFIDETLSETPHVYLVARGEDAEPILICFQGRTPAHARNGR